MDRYMNSSVDEASLFESDSLQKIKNKNPPPPLELLGLSQRQNLGGLPYRAGSLITDGWRGGA